MAIYLYCRISKKTQNIERQKRNLKEAYPEGQIVEERYTGTTTSRPQWTRIYTKAAEGDTIVFDSVSRMSRNAEEGIEIYEELYKRGVELVFLKEPQVNTETYKSAIKQHIALTGNEIADEFIKATNNVLIILAKQQYKLAFDQAEKEVVDLQQRTKEGMKTAKLNGKEPGAKKGQKWETKRSKEVKAKILKYAKDFNGTLKDVDVMKLIDGESKDGKKITRNSYYKYKKELAEDRSSTAEKEVEDILTATEDGPQGAANS